MDDAVILYTTWPEAETAERVAAEAVAEHLCACANLLGPMRSVYRWKGAVENAAEVPVLFKTTAARAEALKAFILARHPNEVPCVLALPVRAQGSNPAFLAWIAAEAPADPDLAPSV